MACALWIVCKDLITSRALRQDDRFRNGGISTVKVALCVLKIELNLKRSIVAPIVGILREVSYSPIVRIDHIGNVNVRAILTEVNTILKAISRLTLHINRSLNKSIEVILTIEGNADLSSLMYLIADIALSSNLDNHIASVEKNLGDLTSLIIRE